MEQKISRSRKCDRAILTAFVQCAVFYGYPSLASRSAVMVFAFGRSPIGLAISFYSCSLEISGDLCEICLQGIYCISWKCKCALLCGCTCSPLVSFLFMYVQYNGRLLIARMGVSTFLNKMFTPKIKIDVLCFHIDILVSDV